MRYVARCGMIGAIAVVSARSRTSVIGWTVTAAGGSMRDGGARMPAARWRRSVPRYRVLVGTRGPRCRVSCKQAYIA